MLDHLRRRLQGVLDRLEANTSKADMSPDAEMAYLKAQLAAIEQDEQTIGSMLKDQKDSFHHNIAAGTTEHAQAVQARKERLLARMRSLEAKWEETPADKG